MVAFDKLEEKDKVLEMHDLTKPTHKIRGPVVSGERASVIAALPAKKVSGQEGLTGEAARCLQKN